ncbi:RNA-directed DNA polymerase, eukaryota, reverse transcriptase zinc-binding domain protein [Tanacetum coccineum]
MEKLTTSVDTGISNGENTGLSSYPPLPTQGSTPAGGNGVDVVVPVESIRVVSKRFANTASGFFLGKRVAYPDVANYVRNTWGANSDERKATWISWKKVLASKLEGGLGVNSIFSLNHALLYKWVWRFRMQPNAIWSQVVRVIHGNDGLLKEPFRKSYPNLIWVTIIKAISSLKDKRVDLMEFCQKKVGDGQEIKVVAKLEQRDGLGSYRRLPRGGIEEVQMMEMRSAISLIILSPALDTWVWTLDGFRSFTVGSARKYIDKKLLISGSEPTRWCKVIPQKVNILAWRILLDKLPTHINLDVRGFDVPSILCPICDTDVAFVSAMVTLVFESSAKEDAKYCFGGFVFFDLVARVGP